MSWSISFIGKPDKIKEALEKYSTNLSGPSKDEYDAVLPSLINLVSQNVGENTFVKISANGSASRGVDGAVVSSSCSMTLENIWGALV